MASQSSSSHSEGEIVESDTEKATTSIVSHKGTNVDRPFRKSLSVSRSPSPVRSPRHYKSRDQSRSPYRKSRSAKRPPEDDHYDHVRNDPRRFRVRYEDSRYGERGRERSSHRDDVARHLGPGRSFREDRVGGGPSHGSQPRTRSRSPFHSRSSRPDNKMHDGRNGRADGPAWRREQDDRGYRGNSSMFSNQQSVSDRGQGPVAAARAVREAEIKFNQKQHNGSSSRDSDQPRAECVPLLRKVSSAKVSCISPTAENDTQPEEVALPTNGQVLDDAALIEERRKRREAIKAKHRGQATPMQLQALALDSKSVPPTPMADVTGEMLRDGKQRDHRAQQRFNTIYAATPRQSPPPTPQDASGQESPTDLVLLKDGDLANKSAAPDTPTQRDEPSAADYDPTMDMQEDKMRHDQRQRKGEVSSSTYDEKTIAKQDVLLPDAAANQVRDKTAEDGFDMFAEGDDVDMFAEAPATSKKLGGDAAKAVPIPQAKALDMSMLDDWDDSEGYYKVILGELLDNRYHVQSNLGKGMFSGVVRATDQKTRRLVAIKLIRNNETM